MPSLSHHCTVTLVTLFKYNHTMLWPFHKVVESLHYLHFENVNCISCELLYSNEFHHSTWCIQIKASREVLQLIMQQTVIRVLIALWL